MWSPPAPCISIPIPDHRVIPPSSRGLVQQPLRRQARQGAGWSLGLFTLSAAGWREWGGEAAAPSWFPHPAAEGPTRGAGAGPGLLAARGSSGLTACCVGVALPLASPRRTAQPANPLLARLGAPKAALSHGGAVLPGRPPPPRLAWRLLESTPHSPPGPPESPILH